MTLSHIENIPLTRQAGDYKKVRRLGRLNVVLISFSPLSSRLCCLNKELDRTTHYGSIRGMNEY